MNKRNIFRIYILLFIILLLIFSICIITGLLMIGLRQIRDESTNSKRILEYKRTTLNTTTMKYRTGKASIPFGIKKDEFLFEDYNGKLELLSNFGVDQFFCTGSCYCSEKNSRRLATSVRNGLSFLLAAVSGIAAVHTAREYFFEECKNEMVRECDLSLHEIKSEVDSCKSISDEQIEEEEVLKEFDPNLRHFWCRGKCSINKKVKKEGNIKKAVDLCSRLKDEGKVEVLCQSGVMKSDCLMHAKKVFHETYLTSFCRDYSVYRRNVGKAYVKRSRKPYRDIRSRKMTIRQNLCVSGKKKEYKAMIQCKEIVEGKKNIFE